MASPYARQCDASAALAAVLAAAGLPVVLAEDYGRRLDEARGDGCWAVVSATLIVELAGGGWSTAVVDALDEAVASLEVAVGTQVRTGHVPVEVIELDVANAWPVAERCAMAVWSVHDDAELAAWLSGGL